MDTVEGIKGIEEPCLLSLLYLPTNLQLYFKMERKTIEESILVFSYIKKSLGIQLFKKTFEVILTDNGVEFKDPLTLETDPDTNEQVIRIFFCHPRRSDEKASCERNHRELRRMVPQGISWKPYTPADIIYISNNVNSIPNIKPTSPPKSAPEKVETKAKTTKEVVIKKSLKDMQESLNQSLAAANSNNVNVAKLVDQVNESNQYIRHLVEVKSKSDSLNMVLTNNLTRSLSKEDMKEVDVQVMKGVVYISLADNMLYQSGSYEISDRAAATLSKIAKIISDYKDYDVLIEGNTDNVPMKGTNIRNNWDLSCLRASSVVQCLQNKYGVDPKRLTAGGRGEFNPIADNNTDAGRATNRRTQIIITPKLDEFMDLIGKAPGKK